MVVFHQEFPNSRDPRYLTHSTPAGSQVHSPLGILQDHGGVLGDGTVTTEAQPAGSIVLDGGGALVVVQDECVAQGSFAQQAVLCTRWKDVKRYSYIKALRRLLGTLTRSVKKGAKSRNTPPNSQFSYKNVNKTHLIKMKKETHGHA